jgi:hypothetical protein
MLSTRRIPTRMSVRQAAPCPNAAYTTTERPSLARAAAVQAALQTVAPAANNSAPPSASAQSACATHPVDTAVTIAVEELRYVYPGQGKRALRLAYGTREVEVE